MYSYNLFNKQIKSTAVCYTDIKHSHWKSQAFAMVYLTSLLFWVMAQCWHFRTMYWSHLQWSQF